MLKISIIGAKGEMGKLLSSLFSSLGEIIPIDKDSSKKEWEKAWMADIIWLSVPRDVIDNLLQGKKFKKEKLIVEICSIKRGVSKIIKKTGASFLSLHPLHGPYVALEGQRWVVIKKESDLSHPLAKKIISFLKKKGIKIFFAPSEEYHDFIIGMVLSLLEMLTIVLEKLIFEHSKRAQIKKPSLKELSFWLPPGGNLLLSAYTHIIKSTPLWLRKDLLLKSKPNFFFTAKKTFEKLSKLDQKEVEKIFERQEKLIDKAGINYPRMKFWIERWFEETTKILFKKEKPKIEIEFLEDLKKIFPSKKKIKVGIHGIEGCFSHESFLRFCEEQKISLSKIEIKFLVSAKKVISAIKEGLIDRGVVAVYNSGSGMYRPTLEFLAKEKIKIFGVYSMSINQCLLCHKSTSLKKIKKIFAHPQALKQCRRTLEVRFPQIKLIYGSDDDDTALCAKRIAEGSLSKDIATLASETAAKIYNLKILAKNMEHDPFNKTTFLLVG